MRAALFLFVWLCAAFSWAQYDMTNMGAMQARPSQALQRPEIRKELKLTRDQSKEIDKIESDLIKTSQSAAHANNFPDMTAPFKKMDEADAAVMAVLDDAQKTRLTQIRVQIIGPIVATDPELGKPLALTDDQIAKIKAIHTDQFNAVMDEMQHHHDAGVMKRVQKLRDQAEAKMVEVFTDEQKAKYKEMQGPIFKDARKNGLPF